MSHSTYCLTRHFILAVAATQNVILEQYSKHDLKQERDFYEDVR